MPIDSNPDEWEKKFLGELSSLERSDKEAYDTLIVTLRTAMVAAILQWKETAQHLTSLMLRIASQKKTDAIRLQQRVGVEFITNDNLALLRLSARLEGYTIHPSSRALLTAS